MKHNQTKFVLLLFKNYAIKKNIECFQMSYLNLAVKFYQQFTSYLLHFTRVS